MAPVKESSTPQNKQDATGKPGSASERRYTGFNARWKARTVTLDTGEEQGLLPLDALAKDECQDSLTGKAPVCIGEVAGSSPAPGSLPPAEIDLRCGDVLAVLRDMEPAKVSVCVTSPPYYGLRQYFPFKARVLKEDLDSSVRNMVVSRLNDLKVIPKS